MVFQPDYNNIVDAATNVIPRRIPLYEHIISDSIMEKILGVNFAELIKGNISEKKEYFYQYTRFYKQMGYDTVSFEQCITRILPGNGALYKHCEPVIKTRKDFENYPWECVPDAYFNQFKTDFTVLQEVMPNGMKAIGGPGNGLFEIVQDLCGYEGLCFISIDDPDLYAALFSKAGEIMKTIWARFLVMFSDLYCVCRFGDDLGFNTQTLLPEIQIRKHIIPRYYELIELIHGHGKPFLLHSCGNIFSIMEDLIIAGIDAKHSNEDSIAPFSTWVDKYGDRIGNFGGVDTNILCTSKEAEIKDYVIAVYQYCSNKGGFALGSGNSIPEYIPQDGYLAMIEAGRRLRGE